MQQVELLEQTAVWYSSCFEKVNSTGAWMSSSKACERDIKLLQALLTSFLSLCIVLYCSGLENTQCGALWATVALLFFWQFKENNGKALSDSGRPAQVFESRPWAKLNVLQNSGSWMFILRVKTLQELDGPTDKILGGKNITNFLRAGSAFRLLKLNINARKDVPEFLTANL